MNTDGRQALVVDDNAQILLHATEILEEAGFSTLTAVAAEEAVALLERYGGSIALLFTDVEMPGAMDGFALARLTAEKWPSVGILVASGERIPQEGDLPEGAVFVAKPFSSDVVYDRVHEILPDERKPKPLQERPRRDFQKERDDHGERQDKAAGKIAAQENRMTTGQISPQQQIDDQQIMNEMQGNKASLDFNRAMFDYDDEHREEKFSKSSKSGSSE